MPENPKLLESLKDASWLSLSHVHMRNPAEVIEKINSVIRGGPEKLQVIFDFDRTLTKHHENGTPTKSTFCLLENLPSVSEEVRGRFKRNLEKYLPIEINPKLTVEEKTPYMEEWWKLGIENMKGVEWDAEVVDQYLRQNQQPFRDHTKECLEQLHSSEVPVLVFSAGIGEVVRPLLGLQGFLIPNVQVVSNVLFNRDHTKECLEQLHSSEVPVLVFSAGIGEVVRPLLGLQGFLIPNVQVVSNVLFNRDHTKGCLEQLHSSEVPVLVFSAGFGEVVRPLLDHQGFLTPNVQVVSNVLFNRDHTKECLEQLHSSEVPVLMFSAGIGEVVRRLLDLQGFLTPNVQVVSNVLFNRDHTKECLEQLHSSEVPVLMFSAGIGEVVRPLLDHQGFLTPNVQVVSNVLFNRDHTKECLEQLHSSEVPVLVFSAGIGEVVRPLLDHQGFLTPNVHVVSNFLKIEEGKIAGCQGDIIHIFNKNEQLIQNTTYYAELSGRSNVLLLGDSLGDAHMADGVPHDTVLKIGFLNTHIADSLEQYKDMFDIVLTDDQTMNVLLEILKRTL